MQIWNSSRHGRPPQTGALPPTAASSNTSSSATSHLFSGARRWPGLPTNHHPQHQQQQREQHDTSLDSRTTDSRRVSLASLASQDLTSAALTIADSQTPTASAPNQLSSVDPDSGLKQVPAFQDEDPLTVLIRQLGSDNGYIKLSQIDNEKSEENAGAKYDTDQQVKVARIDADALVAWVKLNNSVLEEVDIFTLAGIEQSSGLETLSSVTESDQDLESVGTQAERLKDLHVSIQKCDTVLSSVEDYLSMFEKDLGMLSAEIETLQNRSIFLNRRLENRREVESRLVILVDDIIVPPHVIKTILRGEINAKWITTIQILSSRLKRMALFRAEIHARQQQGDDSVAHARLINEISPLLDMLADKAVERIRDFIVSKMKQIRVPNTNAQVVQHAVLLKCRSLFSFLANRNKQLAEDISRGYVNIMKWYYSSNFARYIKALDKLHIRPVDRSALLGEIAGANNIRSTRIALNPLTLGRRVNIVFSTDSSVVLELTAEQSQDSFWLEIPFRSLNIALMDNASAEYLFIADFFQFKSTEQQARLFYSIFQPTFTLCEGEVSKIMDLGNMDAFGILLSIRIITLLEYELQRRKVPVMEAYCNSISMLLWPRFQSIMNAHSDSVRKLSGRPPIDQHTSMSGSAASAAAAAITEGISSLLGTTSNTGSGSVKSLLPHPVTQIFATFLAGILELSPEDQETEPVSVSVVRLRHEFEVFLSKYSTKLIPTSSSNSSSSSSSGGELATALAEAQKLRERFLFNNYVVVLTGIVDIEGKLADEERRHFKKLTDAYASVIGQ
ncbi:Sac2 family-domain-containing protein [Lipomyces oligophaga]|uniref:Sac2 family-domain-containing protein n=1 Tax=Lipomyces oligophaga TaxID=45792 RepID=UPI0034CD7688